MSYFDTVYYLLCYLQHTMYVFYRIHIVPNISVNIICTALNLVEVSMNIGANYYFYISIKSGA